MKLDISKKIISVVGALALLVVIMIFGVVLPTVGYIQKTTNDTDALRNYLEQKYEQSLRYKITRNKVKVIKENSATFSSYIFKAGNELGLITYLENLAAKYNLSQNIINSNLDKVTNNHMDIDLSITGDYNKIFKYLSDLDSSSYFLNIEQLQILPVYERNGNATQSSNLYLTLGMYVSH